MTKALFAGGSEGHYNYDLLGRCTAITTPHFKQEIPRKGFDAAGNLRHFVAQDLPYRFDYDHLFQIKQEGGHASHSYQFDSLNNRTQKDGELHHHNSLHQLIRKGSETFAYDGNGNLAARETGSSTIKYTYDALDRLVSVVKNGEETRYSYDPMNRRLSKKQGGNEQLFLYHGQEEIGLYENGSVKEFRLLGNNNRNPMIALELQGALYIPTHDMAGNVVCLQDSLGSPVERYRYTAFGESEILSPDGALRPHSALGNPWQYASKRLDEETGFVHFGLRYYAPDLGRWISPDPIGTEDGPNLYAYVKNSPLNYFDQFGLFVMPFPSTLSYANESIKWMAASLQPSPKEFNSTISYFPMETAMRDSNIEQRDRLCNYCPSKADLINKYYSPFTQLPCTYNLNELAINNPGTNTPYHFPNSPNLLVTYGNGIMNSPETHISSLLYTAKLLNHNVTGIYSPSYGFTNDAQRYLAALFRINTETTALIYKTGYDFLEKNPAGHWLMLDHSRGAADANNAVNSFLLTYTTENFNI